MKTFVLIMGIMVCLVPLATADEAELPSMADTYVVEVAPDANKGSLDFFKLFFEWGAGPPSPEIPLIMFELPPELMGAVVNEAILLLYAPDPAFYDPGSGNVDIFRIAGPWDEYTVAWNNRPGDDRSIIVGGVMPPSALVWFESNVTPIVQAWADGDPNYGFYLEVPNQGATVEVHFATKEFGDPDLRPKLYVRYTPRAVSEDISKPGLVDPVRFHISPNPSAGPIEISFKLSSPGPIALRIYNASGMLVKTLIDKSAIDLGEQRVRWDATKEGLGFGIYFIRLQTPNYTYTQKLVLTR